MRFLRGLGPALALMLAMPAAAEEAPRTATPRPAIWLLQDADTKIYLFGTVHILPPGLNWRSPALERVIGESDELVLEIDAAEMENPDPAALARMSLGKIAPLAWRVSPDRREGLRGLLATSGLPEEGFAAMQTWAAAMTISVAQLAQAYSEEDDPDAALAASAGAEEALTAAFRERGRPISGVETIDLQLGVFAGLPFAAQREMLEEMVDAYNAEQDRGADAVAALGLGEADEEGWLTGDLDGIAAEMEELSPLLYDVLLTRRNRNWTDWLIRRLDRPGTVLFAVGAGHLAGRDSVQSMLAARGFTVTRVN